MNVHDYRFLLSEQATLKKLISQTSPGNVIGRMSLEFRLKQVGDEIKAYEGYSHEIVNARLTFQGSPVIENRGVKADFGTEAVNVFAESVAKVGAGWHTAPLSRGLVPNSSEYQLLITGTATGSFGFQLEDASQQPVLEGQAAPIEMAIRKVKEILEASVGTDEELSEVIADTDQQALDSIQRFLKKMADNRATCALEFQGNEFRFRDVAQVRRSENRLSHDNIRETNVTLHGYFQGFLPDRRSAEFFLLETDADFLQAATNTALFTRIEPAVVNTININEILNRAVRVEARARRAGRGRPRYVITDCQLKA